MNAATLNNEFATYMNADTFGLTAAEQAFANAAPAEQPSFPEIEVAAEGTTVINNADDFGKKLRKQTLAVRLRQSKWGISKKLTVQQVEHAADQFHAERSRLSASKKLIDSKHKKFRAVVSTLNAAKQYWREMTVPYPEFGIRLIPKDRVEQFKQRMDALKAELLDQVQTLQHHYNEMIEASRAELGELFNPLDYPLDISGLFGMEYEFPSLAPDAFLQQLNPALYEAEQKRIQARFAEAVAMTEQAFMAEFTGLVTNLAERLQMGDDGKPRSFRNEAVGGLSKFFERFKDLNIGSNAELDRLVEQAQELIKGDPTTLAKTLRKDVTQRDMLQRSLAELGGKLTAQLVAKPSRKMSLLEDVGGEADGDEAAGDESIEINAELAEA